MRASPNHPWRPLRRRGLGPAALLAIAAACVPVGPREPVELEVLATRLGSDAPASRTPEGIALAILGTTWIHARFPSLRALELDVVADSPLDLYWAPFDGDELRPGEALGHRALLAGPASLRLDLAPFEGWRPDSGLALMVHGTGRLLLTGARVEPAPAEPEAFRALADRATRWRTQTLSHATVNFLAPPWWDNARRSWLPVRLAAAALVAGGAVLVWERVRRGRARPSRAVAAAALVALLGYDAFFLRRTLPILSLVPEPDPEARIRERYAILPQAGALAALARATLAPGERVGVIGAFDDWFGPQVLCFNLAPRPAVVIKPRETVHAGLSGVVRLGIEELDAIVMLENDALLLPQGFERVAGISARSFVARRR